MTTTTTTCKYCGRYRKDHGKISARCPNPTGLTWKHFEARTDGGEYDGTLDYEERVQRDERNKGGA